MSAITFRGLKHSTVCQGSSPLTFEPYFVAVRKLLMILALNCTIHGAKGGEADNVMLLTDLSKKTDEAYWLNKDEERRVFYVGMTRAKQSLNVIRSKSNREFTEVF